VAAKTQVEIQLGHMCNNRCVFCVSGQETEVGNAGPVDVTPVLQSLDEARARGITKVTLLGGEPTLQPGFLIVVKHAVAIGFDEIVLFTNGVKTAREAVIDEILATGGNFTWRISIQGATKETHEATTKKPGSFDRIVRTMEHLKRKGETLTVNMCVVQSNYASVDAFPALLAPYDAKQLHLDMVRPRDAGVRTEDELRAMIPRYSDMVGPLERMIRGFPDGFDVNLGNVPYCVAPDLAPWIHHDGQPTLTVSMDGEKLSRPWDKYLVKRQDKGKPASCSRCVFDGRCSGVFDAYQAFYGTSELQPVTEERLLALDPGRKMFALHVLGRARKLATFQPPAPFTRLVVADGGDSEVTLRLEGPSLLVVLALRAGRGGVAGFRELSLHVVSSSGDRATTSAAVRAVAGELAAVGFSPVFPVADDPFQKLAPSVTKRLGWLHERGPFGDLEWTETRVSEEGRRVEIALASPDGGRATVWLSETNGKPDGGYRLDGVGGATPALVAGLREVLSALRVERPTAAATASDR
jgi:MoaA/NifB/PqqE/SkfB family radical SAM enzyme